MASNLRAMLVDDIRIVETIAKILNQQYNYCKDRWFNAHFAGSVGQPLQHHTKDHHHQ